MRNLLLLVLALLASASSIMAQVHTPISDNGSEIGKWALGVGHGVFGSPVADGDGHWEVHLSLSK